ncbi:MAG: replicative DNA helicase [Clostridia bacterium]|jgi:replicative DNA helicase|nr:replicative DNA helicase [Clostridia bacterium]
MADKKTGLIAKMMPHSLEAEQAVLGSAFIDPEAAVSIVSALKENDFYSEAHSKIFGVMQTLYLSNVPIDFITVIDAIEKENIMGEIGGIDYLITLTNIVPSSANYKHHLEIVQRTSVLRKLINASQKIIEKAYENEDKNQVLAFAEKSIFDIAKTLDSSDLTPLKESLEEVLNKFDAIAKDPDSLKGLNTGFYALDKITNGLQKSDLIFIAARPGVGKSSLGMNIVNYAAIHKNAKCAVFSLEMPRTQIAQRALCSIGYVSMSKALSGELSIDEWKALWGANKKLAGAQIFVDDSSLNTPMDIISKCRRLQRQHGLDLIMIDYIQLMSLGVKKTENRQQEISEISRSLKILARELDVPVIVLSQLSRAVETRKPPRPILSDLRESGAIEQDADIVMFIYRPEQDGGEMVSDAEKNIAEIIIAKHRNGATGTIKLKWVEEIVSFKNFDRDSNSQSLDSAIGKPAYKKPDDTGSLKKDVSEYEVPPESEQVPQQDFSENSDILDIFDDAE